MSSGKTLMTATLTLNDQRAGSSGSASVRRSSIGSTKPALTRSAISGVQSTVRRSVRAKRAYSDRSPLTPIVRYGRERPTIAVSVLSSPPPSAPFPSLACSARWFRTEQYPNRLVCECASRPSPVPVHKPCTETRRRRSCQETWTRSVRGRSRGRRPLRLSPRGNP